MNETTIIKKIDSLGRFCIPQKIRRKWNITELDTLQIFADNNGIHIKKSIENNGFEKPKACYERAIDIMGRLTIPYELRDGLNFEPNGYYEVMATEDSIYIIAPRKCAICGETEDLRPFMNKYICKGCLNALKKELRF